LGPVEVWIPGCPFFSLQWSLIAPIFVMLPSRLVTATSPLRLTEVRDGSEPVSPVR